MFLLKLVGAVLGFMLKQVFTFHNVSIKTETFPPKLSSVIQFTFHNVSIKTCSRPYLLVPGQQFTFHNVSIKTCHNTGGDSNSANLHSTMFLLKQRRHGRRRKWNLYLHSTMFLLKRCAGWAGISWQIDLHSTMFLLKLARQPLLCQRLLIYIPQCFY